MSNVQWQYFPGDVRAVAPLGSLVAIVSSKLDTETAAAGNVKCKLRICTGGASTVVTSVSWLVRLESLLALQWSDIMLLAAIFYNACVRVFSAHGELMYHYYLFFSEENPKEMPIDLSVVTLCTWGGGVIYVSKETSRFYVQRGFEKADCTHFYIGDYALRITSIGVVPNEEWRDCVVILTTVDGASYISMSDLMKCQDEDTFQRHMENIELGDVEPYNDVIVCSHPAPGDAFTYFALCNVEKGTVASCKYENNAVALLWQDAFQSFRMVHVVGDGVLALERDTGITFTSGRTQSTHVGINPICINTEIGGGIRIFTAKSVEFYKIVCKNTERVFAQETCDPAAVLVKTYEMFNDGDAKASETVRMIRDDVMEAVDTCIKAAEASWETDTATMLLNTALFGRSMSSIYSDPGSCVTNTDAVVNITQDDMRNGGNVTLPLNREPSAGDTQELDPYLARMGTTQGRAEPFICDRYCRAIAMVRVANCIREPPCDIRTNTSQLIALGPRALVVILAAIKCHLMAIRIADFLGVDKRDILLHWVRTRIKLGGYITDGELVEVITKSLEGYAGVVLPYSDIAEVAIMEKRKTLALALLEKERSLVKRFRVLCKWQELTKAAAIAADACNPLYAAYVLLEAQNETNIETIIDIANTNAFVRDLFIKHCLIAGDTKVLQIFYERTNDIMSAGVNSVQQALEFIDKTASEAVEHTTVSSMHQLISRLSLKQDTQSEDCMTWLKFSSGFFGSIVTSKGTYKPAVVESATLWKEGISQQIELINAQTALENSANLKEVGLVGKSLMHTIFILYRYDMAKQAETLATKFKVPFNQLWRCRLAASYEVHNINDLLQMAMDKEAHAQQSQFKNGKGPVDIVIDALLSLGATSAVESVVATLKPPHQQQWRNKLNKQSQPSDNSDGAFSLLSKISQHLWQ